MILRRQDFLVRDQKVIERFATNIGRAQTRLSLTENVVSESINLMTRAHELGIQAKNAAGVDRRAFESARFAKA